MNSRWSIPHELCAKYRCGLSYCGYIILLVDLVDSFIRILQGPCTGTKECQSPVLWATLKDIGKISQYWPKIKKHSRTQPLSQFLWLIVSHIRIFFLENLIKQWVGKSETSTQCNRAAVLLSNNAFAVHHGRQRSRLRLKSIIVLVY